MLLTIYLYKSLKVRHHHLGHSCHDYESRIQKVKFLCRIREKLKQAQVNIAPFPISSDFKSLLCFKKVVVVNKNIVMK